MDAGFPLVNYLMISMLVVLLGLKFLSILDVLNTFSMVCMTSIAYIGIYIYFFFINTRRRQFWGEKYEDNLKMSVQKLIDEGRTLYRKEKINNADYPLKMRHDDYNGLTYEKRGKNNYLAYFKK
ncbi:MAG: hypothetical protein A4E26_01216 [Methanobacterium sp. PtaU1.Bin097]|nr:MAG: hypothetical protein A4E26_01216 [Methanobacterium sp. PtaU1.Bin097]